MTLLSGCGTAQTPVTLDAAPYVKVGFTGEDGAGTAVLTVDEAGLLAAIWAAMGLSATPETASEEDAAARAALAGLTVWATPESALSNGDTVWVEGTAQDASATGASLTFTPFSETVEGLDDTQYLDPFANLTVSWEGDAPEITMTMTQLDTAGEPWTWVSYTADENTGLSPGDVVTVTASADEALLKRLGYALTRTTMEYTVPDTLGSYLTDWAALDGAGQKSLLSKVELQLSMLRLNFPQNVMVRQAGTDIVTLDDSFTLSDFAFDTAYFLTAASGERPQDGPGWYNALVCVYCFNVTTENGGVTTAYSAFALPDITQTAGGLTFQLEDVYYFDTAELDRDSFSPDPTGGAYQVTAAGFEKAGQEETPEG